MCNQCHDSKREHGAAVHGRREVLMAGAALVTAPLLAGVPVGNGPFSARAYGATSATSPLGPLQIQRRAVGPHDVLLDVLDCGICHTDIYYSAARNIKAGIELIRPEDINRAYERVVNKDVRYRFVIDLASMKSVAGSKS
jgi:hypothetical protein